MISKSRSTHEALSSGIYSRVPKQNKQSGFTLIEMIVVIVVLGMVAGLVMIKRPWGSAGLDTDATVRSLVDGLRLARSRAITQERDVAVETMPSGFSVDGGSPQLLPPHQALTAARVVFLPDGGSTGGSVLLSTGQRRIAVSVSWLTGRVNVMEPKQN